MKKLSLALLGALGACGDAEPPGTPLEKGQWEFKTAFATPKIDGLSVDSLRKDLPADTSKTECRTPVVLTGNRFLRSFNFDDKVCKIDKAVAENGVFAAEGQCPALAREIASDAQGGGMKVDDSASRIKITGTYEPRYMKLDADIVMTVTTERGETSRLTINATHTAERIGDCP